MLLKALGTIDLLSGLILILLGAGVNIPNNFLITGGAILFVKSGLGFWQDIGSLIDVVGGLVLLLSAWITFPGMISIIAGLIIAQKGIFSFL
ncbi:MAG: hypothetical protein KKA64_03980 [Nanoarchaeota archaeon]|nr:hypothetical protein [Nanoarchaeota archaeon]